MPQGKRVAEKMAASQGNVSPHCFLVMVGVATWRLEIRWEPGFLLKTKRRRMEAEIDWRGRGKGKGGRRW